MKFINPKVFRVSFNSCICDKLFYGVFVDTLILNFSGVFFVLYIFILYIFVVNPLFDKVLYNLFYVVLYDFNEHGNILLSIVGILHGVIHFVF
jgi:hypothetical protein